MNISRLLLPITQYIYKTIYNITKADVLRNL